MARPGSGSGAGPARWHSWHGARAKFGSPTGSQLRSSHPQSPVGLWDRLATHTSAGLWSTSALLPSPALLYDSFAFSLTS